MIWDYCILSTEIDQKLIKPRPRICYRYSSPSGIQKVEIPLPENYAAIFHPQQLDDFFKVMADLGSQGWEAISAENIYGAGGTDTTFPTVLFKRPRT